MLDDKLRTTRVYYVVFTFLLVSLALFVLDIKKEVRSIRLIIQNDYEYEYTPSSQSNWYDTNTKETEAGGKEN